AMTRNAELSLSLVQAKGRDVSPRRMAYLVREAEDETREALQPFGYYSPTIEVERDRDTGKVVITVELGPAVRVRASNVTLAGEAEADRDMTDAVAACKPAPGDGLGSILYYTSKALASQRMR